MKNIAHFEQRYMITSCGRVLNLANNTYLTPIENPNGYLKVGLATGDGNHVQELLHRLVAKHYIPNPYDYLEVNHINGDKTDNRVENLEWCSSKQNINHALQHGLRPGYMSANDKEKYLEDVLSGIQVKDLALSIGRRPETLHKMLRETAERVGKKDVWDKTMKENRKNAAIRNLKQINS